MAGHKIQWTIICTCHDKVRKDDVSRLHYWKIHLKSTMTGFYNTGEQDQFTLYIIKK